MSKILTFDEILAVQDIQTKEVEIPEWGGCVKIKEITKAAQQRLRKEATGTDGQPDADRLEVLLLAECMAEPKITVEQAEQLKEKSAGAVDKILMAIMGLNRMTEEAQKQAMKSFRAGD